MTDEPTPNDEFVELLDEDIFFFTHIDNKITYALRRKYFSNDFPWVKNTQAADAMALYMNLKYNLCVQKFPMDFLAVLRNALYERFAKLGVPSEMVDPLVETFGVVKQAMQETADREVNAILEQKFRSKRARKEKTE